MESIKVVFAAGLILITFELGFSQNPSRPPVPVVNPTPKISENLIKNLSQSAGKTPVSREHREQAYAKLLEGQRYFWGINRSRSQSALNNGVKLARQAFQKAIEFDPNLAEAYTALAELTSLVPPNDLEEAILLANIAVRLDSESFGGHRLLARLYTIKSQLSTVDIEPLHTQKAIAEWKEVARLDPRNAEAFAFLSEFYTRTKKPIEQLDALRKWLASATPLDSRFYSTVLGEQFNLSPESASMKYGQALLENGENREAAKVLSQVVADNPENEEAIENLRQAIVTVDDNTAAIAIQSLQQAVFANPESTALIEILAQIQVKTGKIDDATKLLRDSLTKLAGKSKISAAVLQVLLGDIFTEANRFDESIGAYQNALTLRSIGETEVVAEEERDFAIRVFDKLINVYKKATRPNEVKIVIERARVVLGKANSYADKRLVSYYLETNKKLEALEAVRALRVKTPSDAELRKLEARILTEQGRVDEAVTLFKSNPVQITNGRGNGDGTFTLTDAISPEVSNYLYISELYTLAKRPKDAVKSVDQALTVAKSQYEKEIVKLTLATTQQFSGDYAAAEKTLRDLLKESPKNPFALNNLGYFLAERGEKLDEAVKLVEQALAVDPGNPSYLDSLGWAYFKLGKLSEAEKYFKDALRIDDSSSTIQEHLGDVYAKQNKPEFAREAWLKALKLTSEPEDSNRLKLKLNDNIKVVRPN